MRDCICTHLYSLSLSLLLLTHDKHIHAHPHSLPTLQTSTHRVGSQVKGGLDNFVTSLTCANERVYTTTFNGQCVVVDMHSQQAASSAEGV
jgi:hypothetical protein